MSFGDKLNKIVKKNNSLVCVGLDSDLEKLPGVMKKSSNAQFEFNKAIIDKTSDLVCCYKPNIAFYEAEGSKGLRELKLTMDYLIKTHPEVPIILDAKRADIGNTNKGYVKYVFDYLGADAVTIHPYLGMESLKPFLDKVDKGIFILCRTSNKGAGEFQDLIINMNGNKPLYQIVAEKVINDWNINNNCGLVIGGTYPVELEIVRQLAKSMPILIPGVGAQGADAKQTVLAGVDKKGRNAIINSSRGIIFKSTKPDFAKKARSETKKLRDTINSYRAKLRVPKT